MQIEITPKGKTCGVFLVCYLKENIQQGPGVCAHFSLEYKIEKIAFILCLRMQVNYPTLPHIDKHRHLVNPLPLVCIRSL